MTPQKRNILTDVSLNIVLYMTDSVCTRAGIPSTGTSYIHLAAVAVARPSSLVDRLKDKLDNRYEAFVIELLNESGLIEYRKYIKRYVESNKRRVRYPISHVVKNAVADARTIAGPKRKADDACLLYACIQNSEKVKEICDKHGVNTQTLALRAVRKRDRVSKVNQAAQPVLHTFAKSLNEDALAGKLDAVVGRDQEIQSILQVLTKRKKCNPVLVS